MLDTEDAILKSYFVSGNKIHIQYELMFILQTFINTEYIWRVQGCVQTELIIPDTDTEDWTVFDDVQGKDFFALYEKYKELVCFQDIVYQDVECDTL